LDYERANEKNEEKTQNYGTDVDACINGTSLFSAGHWDGADNYTSLERSQFEEFHYGRVANVSVETTEYGTNVHEFYRV
jgi:hypothetical protein